MNALELKVPPPVVALVAALGMWAISRMTFAFEVDIALRTTMAVVIALIGGAFDIAGIAAFRRVRTTLNPMKPGAASSLVTGGIYRVTRNPMYSVCSSCSWPGRPFFGRLGPYSVRFSLSPT